MSRRMLWLLLLIDLLVFTGPAVAGIVASEFGGPAEAGQPHRLPLVPIMMGIGLVLLVITVAADLFLRRRRRRR